LVSPKTFKELALSFPGASAQPHFERTAFKVKKIFATLDEKIGLACILLSDIDQSVFCAFDNSIIYPVPNKWGKQGATYVELKKVRKGMLKDMLNQAYEKCIANPAKKKIA